jgi:CRISPR-associated protein Csd1
MILQQLHADAETILHQAYGQTLPPAMYGLLPVAYVIEVSPDDNDARLIERPRSKKGEQKALLTVPTLGRTSGVAAILLVDKPAYVLGVPDGKTFVEGGAGGGKARDQETRLAFREGVRACYEATGLAALEPVLRFLDRWDPRAPDPAIARDITAEMKSNDLIGFRLRGDPPGTLLSDHPAVRAYWAEKTRQSDGRKMTCLVTGEEGWVESKLPVGIKGVPGGQSAGAALSSFNENAFESYGLGPYSAPISRDAGERFGRALNALLDSKQHSKVVGPFDSGVVYAWWSSAGPVEMSMLEDEPTKVDPDAVRDLLDAVRSGKRQYRGLSADAPFHLLGLSSHSGGRAVIRTALLDRKVGEIWCRQAEWFERTEVIAPDGEYGKPCGLPRLIESAYRERKEVPNHLTDALFRSALEGYPPPAALLPAVVQRCRIGTKSPASGRREHVTQERAALLKLLLSQLYPIKIEADHMSFDTTATDNSTSEVPPKAETAYRCGRLLAHLERIQYAALGRVNATLVDRYYGGASTTPRAVFVPLLRLANQAHLPKVRREKGAGFAQRLQDELADITAPLGMVLPAHLGQMEQGSFALGYYFQRAQSRREAAEARAAREATADPEDVATDAVDPTEENEN